MANLIDRKKRLSSIAIKLGRADRKQKRARSHMGYLDVLCIGRPSQDTLLSGEIFKPVCKHGVCYENIQLGTKANVQDVSVLFGGNALNAAITFARQGLSTAILAQLGIDLTSKNILEIIKDERISTESIYIDPTVKVAQSTNIISTDGERAILTYPGSAIHTQELLSKLDSIETRWIYISSVGSMDFLSGVFNFAKINQIKIAFNPGGVELIKSEETKRLMDGVDTLIMNKSEAVAFFGDLKPVLLCRAAAKYVKVAIITDGQNGSYAFSSGKDYHQPISDNVKVIDRTGAGDAFASGVVASLAWGKSLEDALLFGSQNSTSVVQYIGAHQGILSKFNVRGS